jgi:hypothetical protein
MILSDRIMALFVSRYHFLLSMYITIRKHMHLIEKTIIAYLKWLQYTQICTQQVQIYRINIQNYVHRCTYIYLFPILYLE